MHGAMLRVPCPDMEVKSITNTALIGAVTPTAAQTLLQFAHLPSADKKRFILHLNAFLYASPQGRRESILEWEGKLAEARR